MRFPARLPTRGPARLPLALGRRAGGQSLGPLTDLYADSVNGSDSKNGRSEANAVQTLDEMAERLGTTADVTLHLAKGSTFTVAAGTFADVEFTVSLYGSGANPVVNGMSVADYYTFVVALLAPACVIDPSVISSLWTDTGGTAQVTGDNQNLMRMTDLTGHGYDWTSVGNPKYRTNVVNGQPVIRFDGTDDTQNCVLTTLFRNVPALYMLTVIKVDGSSAAVRPLLLCRTGAGIVRIQSQIQNTSNFYRLQFRRVEADTIQLVDSVLPATTGEFIVLEQLVDWSNRRFSISENSVEALYTHNVLTSGNGEDVAATVTALGGGGTRFTGDRGITIFLQAAPTDADRSRAIRALFSRYNVTANPPALVGAWSEQFTHPCAIELDGKTVFGAVFPSGGARIVQHDGDLQHLPIVLTPQAAGDDHNSHGFHVLPDGRLLAGSSQHADTDVWQYVTTNPNDATEWEAEESLDGQFGKTGYAYTQFIQLSGEDGRLYRFFRALPAASLATWCYSTSDDNGVTWATAKGLFEETGRHYSRYFGDNTRIDVAVVEGHPIEFPANSLYHAYIESGVVRATDGTSLGALATDLPITDAELASTSRVFDGTGTPGCMPFDIRRFSNGDVVILFARFEAEDDHRWMYAICLNGQTSFTVTEICTAGNTFMDDTENQWHVNGYGCIHPENKNIVYVGRKVDSNGDVDTVAGISQVYRCTTANGGTTFSLERLTNDAQTSQKMTFVAGKTTEPRLGFVYGDYPNYQSDYDTIVRFIASDGAAV